jgi:hypothetical protein
MSNLGVDSFEWAKHFPILNGIGHVIDPGYRYFQYSGDS